MFANLPIFPTFANLRFFLIFANLPIFLILLILEGRGGRSPEKRAGAAGGRRDAGRSRSASRGDAQGAWRQDGQPTAQANQEVLPIL